MAKPARNHSSNALDANDGSTPAALGYRMPAEWEPHAGTWMAWPHYRGDWPGKFEPVPWVYAEIIRNLARHERVELVVADAAAERQARKVLERGDALSVNVHFHRWPTNRVWTRDAGCIFVAKTQPGFARSDSPFDSAQGRLSGCPHTSIDGYHEDVAAFAFFVGIPVAIEQPGENLRLHHRLFGILERFRIASFVCALGINIRGEQNVLTVGRPEFTAGFRGN